MRRHNVQSQIQQHCIDEQLTLTVTTITMEKPKRPLSSFNLFYRYKRFLVTGQGDISKEAVKRILICPAGLEDDLQHKSQRRTSSKTNELRRNKIRSALEGKILPSTEKKKRRHRKAENGPSISFVEMGRLMSESWKCVDPFARQVFDEFAAEGRQFYKDALEEYNRMQGHDNDKGAGKVTWASRSDQAQKDSPSKIMPSPQTEKVSVHKVSRSVKKESFKAVKDTNTTLMLTRSQDSRRASQASRFPTTYDTTRSACLNPEYTSRAFPNSGFAPSPELSETRAIGSATTATGDTHQFPPPSYQVENQQLLPQSHLEPRLLYHQQHYHRYQQRLQQQQRQHQEGHDHDANFKTVDLSSQQHFHHDAHNANHNVHPHPASAFRVVSTSPATGGRGGGRRRDDGEHARVEIHDDYADNPADLNLKNEDIKTFFDAVDRWK